MQPRDAGIGIERKEVTVLGTAADLLAITTDGRFNGYRLVLRLPSQVVVAQTTAAVNAGVQVNPLLDEAAFLEALENLQLYPN
jgi:hypothetical protein